MIAPGKEILSPMVRLRMYYLMTGTGFIFLILLVIRFVTRGTVSSIRNISRAADKIARGDYGDPLPVKSRDEVGELTRSFNTMALQLEERIRLKEALDVAMEVQQNLLPTQMPKVKGLDIAGKSIYCDETGGDLYDFLEVCSSDLEESSLDGPNVWDYWHWMKVGGDLEQYPSYSTIWQILSNCLFESEN